MDRLLWVKPLFAGVLSTVGLVAAADVSGDGPAGVATGVVTGVSAVAVLAWWVKAQQQTLRDQQQTLQSMAAQHQAAMEAAAKTHKETIDLVCTRQDAWQQMNQRTLDNLSCALRELSVTCAGRQSQRPGNGG